MPRPRCCRRISGSPPVATSFHPQGVSRRDREEVVLTLDELEALRLADFEGLYQEQAAERMGISRATFGRVVEQARHKVAGALVGGKSLRIEGGVVAPAEPAVRRCARCDAEGAEGAEGGKECPRCAVRGCGRGRSRGRE